MNIEIIPYLKSNPFWNALLETSNHPSIIVDLYYHVATLCRMGFFDIKILENSDVNIVTEFMNNTPSMDEIDDFLSKMKV